MSLQKYLLSLEKKRDTKNRGEDYWKAREQSIDDADNFHDKIRLWMMLFAGIVVFSVGLNSSFGRMDWIETKGRIYSVSEVPIQSDFSDYWQEYRTKYSFYYSIGGRNYEQRASIYGKAAYSKGQDLVLYVNPKDPSDFMLRDRYLRDVLLFLGFSLFFLGVPIYQLFLKGQKKASLASTKPQKKPQKNPRRGL